MPRHVDPLTGLLTGLLVAALPLHATSAADKTQTSRVDFNREVRSIFSVHCLKCHGRDQGNRQAGLRLDLRASGTGKLESGRTAIVPGKPAKSSLLARITSPDPDLR
ncbi:MAG: c-type cytochrome domain-containing protein, partial [Planctomycetaceae bacterium]